MVLHIANLFEGYSIGRFKIGWLFKYSRSCTIHSGIFTDDDNEKYRIAVNLFINDNYEAEFEWQKVYYDGMHSAYNEITDDDITPFERMSVQLFLKFILEKVMKNIGNFNEYFFRK